MRKEIDWEIIEERLMDAIMVTCKITCSKCKETHSAQMIDDIDWARELRREKWYATPNNIYCPKCNLKRKLKGAKK